jgi:hypothetical protein
MTVSLDCYNVILDNSFIKNVGELTSVEREIELPAEYSIYEFELTMNSDFNFNYCYISEFKRYYFIDILSYKNNKIKIKLVCDYLMSFKDFILDNFFNCIESNLDGTINITNIATYSLQTMSLNNVAYIQQNTGNEIDYIMPTLTRYDIEKIKERLTDIVYFNFRIV